MLQEEFSAESKSTHVHILYYLEFPSRSLPSKLLMTEAHKKDFQLHIAFIFIKVFFIVFFLCFRRKRKLQILYFYAFCETQNKRKIVNSG